MPPCSRFTSAQDLTHTGRSTVLDSIMKEVQALIDVSQHPNIVRFIGACVGEGKGS